MMHYKNWFNDLHVPEQPSYVETGDDTVHPIERMENVPLATHDGKPKHMADVLYVPTITKNLLLVKWQNRDYKSSLMKMVVMWRI